MRKVGRRTARSVDSAVFVRDGFAGVAGCGCRRASGARRIVGTQRTDGRALRTGRADAFRALAGSFRACRVRRFDGGDFIPRFIFGFRPAEVLKGVAYLPGARLRQVLVVAQFAIAILLVIVADVIYRQLDFIQHKDLGFDKEHLVLLPIFKLDRRLKTNDDPWLVARYNTVKQAFLEHPNIVSASAFRFLPGRDGGGFVRIVKPEGQDHTEWRMPCRRPMKIFCYTGCAHSGWSHVFSRG